MNVKAIRDRAHHFIAPDVAADVGLSFEELREFVAGTSTPPPDKLVRLAARIKLSREDIE